jgi:glutamyl/glutaminyl-tRNA synthetase
MTERCRFAPSPTGLLHVGGARTALFAWLFAKSREDGKFVLRVEDTDRARSTLSAERAIVADLAWLGLSIDEGPEQGGVGAPYRQSERLELYDWHIQELLQKGLAYEAWETREELDAMRAEVGQGFRYRRRPSTEGQVAAWRAEGRKPIVRFQVPLSRGRIGFIDDILGEVEVDIDEVDDFVIRKADGFPTYHFAVVIDDHLMQITQVLRAQEHLKNTLKHVLLYEALGWEDSIPRHGHMPLIYSMTGGKMSKRDKARVARAAAREAGLDAAGLAAAAGLDQETAQSFLKKKTDEVDVAVAVASALGQDLPEIDVIDFRRAGYLPEALANFLALLGFNPGARDDEGKERELFTLTELAGLFRMERMGKKEARFDRDKLIWMNGQYIRSATLDRLEVALDDWVELNPASALASASPQLRRTLLELYKERLGRLGELEAATAWVFTAPTSWGPDKAITKHLLKGDGMERLAAARGILEGIHDWTEAGIEAGLNAGAEELYEGRVGKLAQPLRIAATGGPVSPGIFGTLAMLDKADMLARIDACLAAHTV